MLGWKTGNGRMSGEWVFTLAGAETPRERNLVNQKFTEIRQLDLEGGQKSKRGIVHTSLGTKIGRNSHQIARYPLVREQDQTEGIQLSHVTEFVIHISVIASYSLCSYHSYHL